MRRPSMARQPPTFKALRCLILAALATVVALMLGSLVALETTIGSATLTRLSMVSNWRGTGAHAAPLAPLSVPARPARRVPALPPGRTQSGNPPLAVRVPVDTHMPGVARVGANVPGLVTTAPVATTQPVHNPPQQPLKLPPVMKSPALVIIAHSRPEYLKQTLASVLSCAGAELFTMYVSLDAPPAYGKMEATIRAVADRSGAGQQSVKILKKTPSGGSAFERSGIGRISRHHEFGLEQGFSHGHSHVIVLEEDLVVSPDFFALFLQTAPLLETDPTLWCVSAWNDNGLRAVAKDPKRLFRTDYPPGLGWMTTAREWQRLRKKWPAVPSTGWDHWMRLSTTNDGRECVAPEVSRTRHIGEHGVNVKSSEQNVYSQWAFSSVPAGTASFGDLSYLKLDRYERDLRALLADPGTDLVLYTIESWRTVAHRNSLWANQPRGTHKGVIVVPASAGKFKIFADQRKAWDYLDDKDCVKQKPGVTQVAGKRGQSCVQVCSGRGQRCIESELQFCNTCEAMLKAFPCEAGCGHQMGREIPSYVAASNERTYQQCLVSTDGALLATCRASHPVTSRLCPCG